MRLSIVAHQVLDKHLQSQKAAVSVVRNLFVSEFSFYRVIGAIPAHPLDALLRPGLPALVQVLVLPLGVRSLPQDIRAP
jgi:hypothetical protein